VALRKQAVDERVDALEDREVLGVRVRGSDEQAAAKLVARDVCRPEARREEPCAVGLAHSGVAHQQDERGCSGWCGRRADLSPELRDQHVDVFAVRARLGLRRCGG
jgi:hypothetical protein